MDGEQIRALRQDLGLTQGELALILGAHQITVSKWERGHTAPRGLQRELLALLEEVARQRRPVRLARVLVSKGAVGALRLVFAWTAAEEER
jgi:putative transcriptional regulator